MKKTLLLFAFGIIIMPTFGQISERENDQTTIKLGARPVAGTMALTFGYNFLSDSLSLNTKGTNFLKKGDLLSFKYYLQDNTVFRVGFRLLKETHFSKGELADSSYYNNVSGTRMITNNYRDSKREYILSPGIEKHFSNSNIFDVYLGGEAAFGFGKNILTNNEEYSNGDFSNDKRITSTMITGITGVVGFNIFIAHLPIALGIEYGFGAKWTLGGKTKVILEDKIGNNSYNAEYFTQDEDAFGNTDSNKYAKLSKREFTMDNNQNVKLTLHLYFNK